MDEDESLRRYGLRPSGAHLDEIRETLRTHAALERRAQGEGDTELMRLCCVQLFNAGDLDDVLTIWDAKRSSWDADSSVDVQLLCGAGLEETKAYLTTANPPEALAALDYLQLCEGAGDFEGFSVESRSRWYADYYSD
ncbi:hypothetical protein ACFFR3_22175 [Nonomuraea salmonea]|uniref:DUF4240 domain-containing protein n=1 Tax=Nonomuraea salmonea TaxID=46181 RepID=A0ABV5NPJ3_9ACTN